MGYEVTTAVEKRYLKLVVSGEQSLENNKELLLQVLETCAEMRVRIVLIDMRATVGQPGILADYELAGIAAHRALGLIQKAALLFRKENLEYMYFFETAIRNRGVNLLAFEDEGEAIEWLLKDSQINREGGFLV